MTSGETGLSLYWISGSPPSWRVMLALEVKGMAYISHRLEASKAEHKSVEFLRLNPRGQVPVLRNGSTVVRESIAILAYLEAFRPEPALFGRRPGEKGAIWQWAMDFESNLRSAATTVAQILLRDPAGDRRKELKEAARLVIDEIVLALEPLRGQHYLCGTTISAADILLYPAIQWMKRAISLNPGSDAAIQLKEFFAASVDLRRWTARIEQIPGFDRTYPPHWRTV